MSFPDNRYSSIADYFDEYARLITAAQASVDRQALDRAQAMLLSAIERDAHIYVCGNGGSAAISNHLICDHVKGISTDTCLSPRVYSLVSNIELLTAIGNDLSYNETFSYPLSRLGRPGDVLLTISSSGDSENIIQAIQWAKEHQMSVIALTGFGGGRSRQLADIPLHVSADNYGVVEDVHQSLMHVLAQFIRHKVMPEELIKERKF